MNPRPFRFGTVAMSAGSKHDWADKARQIEDLGYSVLLVPDHVGSGDQWEPFQQFAPIAALVAAANATTSIRVGGFVFSNVLRHPVLLANEAATVDVLSDGRSSSASEPAGYRRSTTRSGWPSTAVACA